MESEERSGPEMALNVGQTEFSSVVRERIRMLGDELSSFSGWTVELDSYVRIVRTFHSDEFGDIYEILTEVKKKINGINEMLERQITDMFSWMEVSAAFADDQPTDLDDGERDDD